MNVYQIKDWNDHYENNRSRKVKDLAWVPIPNRHDGEAYSRLMIQKDAAIYFSTWILLLQVASRCHPRGSLLTSSGIPHTPESLSIKTRGKLEWFEKSLPFLVQIGWMSVSRHDDATVMPPSCQSGDEERRERKNGMEDEEALNKAKDVLSYLNAKSHKNFETVNSNLKFITSRLNEGYTVEKLKAVVDDKCSKWLNDVKMNEFLRPSTLFNAEKCAQYSGQIGSKVNKKQFMNSKDIEAQYGK